MAAYTELNPIIENINREIEKLHHMGVHVSAIWEDETSGMGGVVRIPKFEGVAIIKGEPSIISIDRNNEELPPIYNEEEEENSYSWLNCDDIYEYGGEEVNWDELAEWVKKYVGW